METELKSLRIDRSQRREREPKAIGKLIAIAIVIAAAAIGAVFAVKKLNAATPVETIQVQSPMMSSAAGEQVVLTATGYIIAAHKIEVASKVNGRVAWIGVDKGDRVQAGQVLVRLEDDEYRAQVVQQQGQLANLEAKLAEDEHGSRPEEIQRARADVNQAKADLADSKATLDRTRQLVSEGVLAKQALDDAQAKYDGDISKVASLQRTLDLAVLGPRKEEIDQIKGQIEQARGALAYAQDQLDNTVIKAPVSGTILDRNVEKGEFITTGFVGDKGAKGYIVTMADLNDLQVELDISQNDLGKLGDRQKGTITTDAYPDRKYPGFIEQVSPEADRAKATVQVKVRVEKPDGFLRPDMNATVVFYNDAPAQPATSSKRVVVVPASAVENGAVFVVVNGRAVKRPVTTSGKSDKGVLIESGLIGGEDLIVNPPAKLKDGDRVEVKQS
ncbi:MAG: efflux RND transporter periplasmic adaptor subunit [Acidobacteriaceae bacterium]|nr:efflux RND transporter periplasmic adaptor subunit [Acidobacteriaceae bacterium]MBV9499095.1 efflux RND transporter periplasmic adaptor subunit [Acidobacteriaceae bacterium]